MVENKHFTAYTPDGLGSEPVPLRETLWDVVEGDLVPDVIVPDLHPEREATVQAEIRAHRQELKELLDLQQQGKEIDGARLQYLADWIAQHEIMVERSQTGEEQ